MDTASPPSSPPQSHTFSSSPSPVPSTSDRLLESLTLLKSLVRLHADGIGEPTDLRVCLDETREALDSFCIEVNQSRDLLNTPDSLPDDSFSNSTSIAQALQSHILPDSLPTSNNWSTDYSSFPTDTPSDFPAESTSSRTSPPASLPTSPLLSPVPTEDGSDEGFNRLSLLLQHLQEEAEAAISTPATSPPDPGHDPEPLSPSPQFTLRRRKGPPPVLGLGIQTQNRPGHKRSYSLADEVLLRRAYTLHTVPARSTSGLYTPPLTSSPRALYQKTPYSLPASGRTSPAHSFRDSPLSSPGLSRVQSAGLVSVATGLEKLVSDIIDERWAARVSFLVVWGGIVWGFVGWWLGWACTCECKGG